MEVDDGRAQATRAARRSSPAETAYEAFQATAARLGRRPAIRTDGDEFTLHLERVRGAGRRRSPAGSRGSACRRATRSR